MLKIIIQGLSRNKLASVSLFILILFYFLSLFAPFFAPYDYSSQFRDKPFHPPMMLNIEFKTIWPELYFYDTKSELSFYKKYVSDKSQKHYLRFFVSSDEYKFLGLIKTNIHFFGCETADFFLLGTDRLGRDIFSRLLYGGRISLTVGVIGVFISFMIGLLIGGISGYFGGVIDALIMRVCEVFMTFPAFYLMLGIRAMFPPSLPSDMVYLVVVVVLSLFGWASFARIIRGMVLAIKEEDFVLSARAIGAEKLYIIFKHILPNTLSYVLVAATLSIPGYILGESALSLFSLGIVEPQASWGNMLVDAKNIIALEFYPWILIPGAMIFITIMCFNLLGDALRDIFDPKGKYLKK